MSASPTPDAMDIDNIKDMMTIPSVIKNSINTFIPSRLVTRYEPNKANFPSKYPPYDNPSSKKTTTWAHLAYLCPTQDNMSQVAWIAPEERPKHIKYMQQREDYRRVTDRQPESELDPDALDALMSKPDFSTSSCAEKGYTADICGHRTGAFRSAKTVQCDSMVRSDAGGADVVRSLDGQGRCGTYHAIMSDYKDDHNAVKRDRPSATNKKRTTVANEDKPEGSKRTGTSGTGNALTHSLHLEGNIWFLCDAQSEHPNTSTRFMLFSTSDDPDTEDEVLAELTLDVPHNTLETLRQILGFCGALKGVDIDIEATLLGISDEEPGQVQGDESEVELEA